MQLIILKNFYKMEIKANSLEIVPSFEYHGPHSRYYRLRVGPKVERFWHFPQEFLSEVELLISYMDKDIIDFFYIDLINFPQELHLHLATLLSHPKLIIK